MGSVTFRRGFGGGWRWKVGVQATKGFEKVVVSLVVVEVTLRRGSR